MKLELTNIEKSFGEKEVLKGISFFAVSGSGHSCKSSYKIHHRNAWLREYVPGA